MRLSEEEKAGLERRMAACSSRVKSIPREIATLQAEQDKAWKELKAGCLQLFPSEAPLVIGSKYEVWRWDEASGYNRATVTLMDVNSHGNLQFTFPDGRAVQIGDKVYSKLFPYDELPLCMFNGDHAPLVHMGHQSSWDDPYDYYAPTCPLCGYHEKPATT